MEYRAADDDIILMRYEQLARAYIAKACTDYIAFHFPKLSQRYLHALHHATVSGIAQDGQGRVRPMTFQERERQFRAWFRREKILLQQWMDGEGGNVATLANCADMLSKTKRIVREKRMEDVKVLVDPEARKQRMAAVR